VLMLVDNVEVPTLNHFASQGTTGGPVSMLNTEFIADATFLAGSFPARYGGRLSAVLDVSLREGSRERYGADLELGFAGAGLIVEGPLTPNGSVMLSARRSFLDLIIRDFGLAAVPRYSNYQAKTVLQLSRNDRLWLVSLGGIDEINFRMNEDDLDDPSLIDIDFSGWRTITGLNWQRLFGSRGFGILGISHAHLAYGSVVRDTELDDAVVFENQSVEAETTLKYDLTVRLAPALDLQAGASAKRLGSDLAIRQPLGYPSPFLLDPGRVNPVALERHAASAQLGAYAQLTRSFADRLDLSAGVRIDHFGLIGASTLSPRASARYRLTPTLSAGASYGIFYQAPSAVFVHADPSNASLQPMRAAHYTGGMTLIPRADVRLSAEAYWKTYRDYPVSAQFTTLSLANAGDDYGVAGLMMPLVTAGTGRSRGIELHAQKKLTGRAYGHLSYTYSRTEHAALDGVLRRGAFDMPHLLSVTGGTRVSRVMEVSGRFTYASGRPNTPFLMGPSQEQNRGIYDLTRVNDVRSPHYQRFDVRVDRRHQFRTWSMTSFFELQNVLDRANVLRYEWNPKTRQPIAWNQIARFPVGGVNIKI
jgi:outer membrane receptor protein involved in Fe transport